MPAMDPWRRFDSVREPAPRSPPEFNLIPLYLSIISLSRLEWIYWTSVVGCERPTTNHCPLVFHRNGPRSLRLSIPVVPPWPHTPHVPLLSAASGFSPTRPHRPLFPLPPPSHVILQTPQIR